VTGSLYTSQLLVPANTPVAAPAQLAVVLDNATLDLFEVLIPDGHNGLTGLAVTWGGTQIIPYTMGTWISGNGEKVSLDYGGEVTQNGLVMTGYNLDIFDHTFYMRWSVSPLTAASAVAIASPQLAATPDAADVATILQLTSAGG
jgi:hypothetical protein